MDYERPPAFARPEDRSGPIGMAAPAAPPFGVYPPAPSKPLSATSTAVAIATVAVAALTVIALVLLVGAKGGSGPDRRVSLPDSAGSYRLIRTIDGDTAEAMLGAQSGSLGPISQALGSARIGLYGVGTVNPLPTVIFLGFDRADSSVVDSLLRSGSPAQVASQILGGTGAGSLHSFDAGALGGALQCAQADSNGTAYTPCVWADAFTLGLVLRVGDVDIASAADVTGQFRAAAEH